MVINIWVLQIIYKNKYNDVVKCSNITLDISNLFTVHKDNRGNVGIYCYKLKLTY